MNFTDTLNAQISLLSLGANLDEKMMDYEIGVGSMRVKPEEFNNLINHYQNNQNENKNGQVSILIDPRNVNKYYKLINSKDLDMILNVRFKKYLNYNKVFDEIIRNLKITPGFEHLSNLFINNIPLEFTEEWKLPLLNNDKISQIQLRQYYNEMDKVCKEWIIDYSFQDDQDMKKKLQGIKNEISTTSELIRYIIKNQDKSVQIQELLLLIINRQGSNEYLEGGFLPYITYMDHLSMAIEGAFENCSNPYRTILMLQIAVQGMTPVMLEVFGGKLSEFLKRYPDFSMYELAEFLRENQIV